MNKKDNIPVLFPSSPYGKFGLSPFDSDVFGSYTGNPKESDELPVQDADDL